MATRQGAPVIGAPEWAKLSKGGWQSSFGFRYQFSDRHFTGDDEEPEREEDNSQVKNTLYLFDFGLTYGLDERTSLSVSLPFQIADRSQLIRDLAPERNVTTARGIGDLVVTARRWMRDLSEPREWNYQLGFGLKFPTGQPNATDTFKFVNEDGDPDREVRTVDQSIQPGDGGFGFLIDVNTYKQFGDEFAGYLSGTYLFNPMETNGVETNRGRDSESIMSIADTYMARGGVQWAPTESWAYGLGLRLEGVPSEDVFGSSDGFRRPGYSWSAEPSVSLAAGRSIFSLALPIALYRNRTRSVPDEQDGRHGDAAFADWVLLFGWTFSL